jgi:catechol 2,3-dioxygenase-like lactoylglutathione lyase family enzyme
VIAASPEVLLLDEPTNSPPVVYEWEIRCFFRDPDGHLLEISEVRSGR